MPPLENWEAIHYIIAAVCLAGLGVALYYLSKYMKGSIKLILPKTHFPPGEKIQGKFKLKTKKPISGQKLVVKLIGVEKTVYYEDGRRRVRKNTFFEEEHLIEQERTYPSGTNKTYEFEFPAPENTGDPTAQIDNTFLKSLVTLSRHNTQTYWILKPRLYSSGVDLSTKQKISIR